jgi:hypothetical protein
VREQELATPAARVAARAVAARRGRSGGSQREAEEGTWTGVERRWGSAHGWLERRRRAAEKQRRLRER